MFASSTSINFPPSPAVVQNLQTSETMQFYQYGQVSLYQILTYHLGSLSFPLMLLMAPLVLAVLETGTHYLSMAAAS